ncbi:MAG: protease pro-enzyme activation domain-containing protein, partial [Thermoanaerobaculia bacterium]
MQRFELKRHVSRRLAQGRRLGAASPSDELRLAVLLHPKDDQALRDATHAVSDPASARYGKFLSAEEVRRLVAPGYQDTDAVVAWLNDAGLRTSEPTGARTVIEVRGTAEAVSRALDAPIGRFAFPTTMFPKVRGPRLAVERNPQIPASLASIVRGIAGLNDLPAARFFPPPLSPARSRVAQRGPGDARGPEGGFTPAAIHAAYGIPDSDSSSHDGAGERIGILEFGGGYSPADFETFCRTYMLPTGNVGEISVSGALNDFRGKTGDADVEVALDMDWVRAAAPAAAIDLYWTPNVYSGWVDFLSMLLDLPENRR